MNGKLNYCTLFNSAYLARGLAMYESLCKVCSDFHLYVFAFDNETFAFFNANQYAHLTVISLTEFEDAELLRIKPTRTSGEYCWTCTPSTILYCIEKFELDHCTYIDADMQFFADPRILNDEAEQKSVIITEHRYSPQYDQSATSGVYCVQYVLFKNDDDGLKVLRWWRNACLEWCFNRIEDGKFGDQKYLDDWTSRFHGVHVLQHHGGGLAPWNLQRYRIVSENGKFSVIHLASGIQQELVFFHFHGLKFYSNETVEYTGSGYVISNQWKKLIYKPYALELFRMGELATSLVPHIANPNGVSSEIKSSHFGNHVIVFRENVLNYLRFLLKRRPSFRKSGNHIYRRVEL